MVSRTNRDGEWRCRFSAAARLRHRDRHGARYRPRCARLPWPPRSKPGKAQSHPRCPPTERWRLAPERRPRGAHTGARCRSYRQHWSRQTTLPQFARSARAVLPIARDRVRYRLLADWHPCRRRPSRLRNSHLAEREIDAQLQPEFIAGRRHIAHHIAASALPGRVSNAVRRGLGIPHTKSALMLGHEDNVARSQVHRALSPVIGIKVGMNRFQRSGEVVPFLVLPGVGSKVDKQADFKILPCELIGSRKGRAWLRSSPQPVPTDCEAAERMWRPERCPEICGGQLTRWT